MTSGIRLTARQVDPDIFDLPWQVPLEDWPERVLATLPRGISRHVVRFVHLNEQVIAVKEIGEHKAHIEYELLKTLNRMGLPCVSPIAVIDNRVSAATGERLETCLITEHLEYSLPYRLLFSSYLKPDTVTRLIDALAVLLVRLHIAGFYWGDVSLSNTLFRRDAEAFTAYLVDAETGAIYPKLSNGQRSYDLEIARVNIIGEMMDLQAGDLLDEEIDATELGNSLVNRYEDLWHALTATENIDISERWRIHERVEQLNALGFDVGEFRVETDASNQHLRIRPRVVDAGHHSRHLLRLTGLDVQENQARTLLNDLASFQFAKKLEDMDEFQVAHEWLAQVFRPIMQAVPRKLRGRMQEAQIFYEVLVHRDMLASMRERDVPITKAAQDYFKNELKNRIAERRILGVTTQAMPIIGEISAPSPE